MKTMRFNNKHYRQGHYSRFYSWISWRIALLLLIYLSPGYANSYPLSSLRGQIVINEVLFKQSGANTATENDEFIELYNAGSVAVDLTRLRLIDGNLFTNEIDGTSGNITGNSNAFNFICSGKQVCTGSSLLPPNTYAVIWVGQASATTHAPQASFQAWLGNAPKLNDTGDDMWLYEQSSSELSLVDYMSVGSGTAVNTNVPSDIWNFSYNASLLNFAKGQSVSLTPNGQLSSSACWETSTSGNASSTCPHYLPSLAQDNTRLMSQGASNTRLYTLSGRVFQDKNVNGLDDSETGLRKVTVVLQKLSDQTCQITRTDTSGAYQFSQLNQGDYSVYEAAQTDIDANTCPPTPSDPNQYTSSSPNQRPVTINQQSLSEINFADVRRPSLSLNHSLVIHPDSVAVYAHRFRSYSSGTVLFSLQNSVATPNLDWASQLYRDVNCNQQLDATDTPLTSALNLSANQTVCVLVKVLSPSNASSGATYTFAVQSQFVFGDGSLIAEPVLQTQRDITRVIADTQGAGNLVLNKAVYNVTRDTEGSVALPSEILRYTLHYTNSGDGKLHDFALHDSVPAFTHLVGTPTCGTTPSALDTCQAVVDGTALEWQFSGYLPAGAEGEVTFTVQVD